MKTLNYFIAAFILMYSSMEAQVSVNVNIGQPPVWAPADRVQTQYYYLPDIGTYYDVPAAQFIYVSNGAWYRSSNLPAHYRDYNLRTGRVVYITDYRGDAPYIHYKAHKVKYKKKGNYYVVHDHHDKGKHKGHGKGKGKGRGR